MAFLSIYKLSDTILLCADTEIEVVTMKNLYPLKFLYFAGQVSSVEVSFQELVLMVWKFDLPEWRLIFVHLFKF